MTKSLATFFGVQPITESIRTVESLGVLEELVIEASEERPMCSADVGEESILTLPAETVVISSPKTTTVAIFLAAPIIFSPRGRGGGGEAGGE